MNTTFLRILALPRWAASFEKPLTTSSIGEILSTVQLQRLAEETVTDVALMWLSRPPKAGVAPAELVVNRGATAEAGKDVPRA